MATYLCILLCICYCFSHLIGLLSATWLSLLYKFTRFFIYFLLLSDEGPMLETLDYTIRIGSTPTFLYFDFVSLLCLRSTLRLLNNLWSYSYPLKPSSLLRCAVLLEKTLSVSYQIIESDQYVISYFLLVFSEEIIYYFSILFNSTWREKGIRLIPLIP